MNAQQTKPTAIVLGGTSPHVIVVEKLQALGYRVVLIDYKDAPPAAAVADVHMVESALDRDIVLKIAREQDAQAIVSVNLDQTLPIVSYVRDEMGLPNVMSQELAHNMTNKSDMKSLFRSIGVETAQWETIKTPQEAKTLSLPFPVVAKPIAGTGSLGVVFAQSAQELAQLLEQSFSFAKDDGVLVESFIEGLELSVDCIVVEGEVHILLERERHKTWLAGRTESTCHGTIAPTPLTPEQHEAVKTAAERIATGFGLKDGPILLQGILTEDERFLMIEVAGRLGGGPGASRVVPLKTGFDYIQASIDQQLGKAVSVDLDRNDDVYAAGNIYAGAGIFDQITGLPEAKRQGLVLDYFIYRSQGDEILDRLSGRSRIAAYAMRASNRQELAEKLEALIELVEVTDTAGASMLLKDIGLHSSIHSSAKTDLKGSNQ